jgi:hypothetical protein
MLAAVLDVGQKLAYGLTQGRVPMRDFSSIIAHCSLGTPILSEILKVHLKPIFGLPN